MKYLKKFNESRWSPEDILNELTLNLKDAGLEVKISDEDTRFHGKGTLFVLITDVNRVFCKKYPEDDLDWLVSKDIMKEFFTDITDFGLIRDKDYKVYGGGLSVTLVFDLEGLKSVKL
jgi:hypothetical protein